MTRRVQRGGSGNILLSVVMAILSALFNGGRK